MQELTLRIGGIERVAYQFNAQNNISQKPYILALHGAGGHPLLFRRVSEIDHAASRFANVLFLAAERHGRLYRWNWRQLDDQDFLFAVIEGLAQKGVKTEDIYIIGMSNGGCLAHLFAATCGLQLGGIGSVCSAMPVYDEALWGNDRKASYPHKVFLANALYDPIMPYVGGQTQGDMTHDILSFKETVEYWKLRLNGRQTSPATSSLAAQILPLVSVQCQYFTSEHSNHALLSLTSSGAKHCWDLIEHCPDNKRTMQRVGRRWAAAQGKLQSSTLPRITEMIVHFMFND
jgi:poly(3-hydroxybutyrate) depolymerase